jgi:hypothetical protein
MVHATNSTSPPPPKTLRNGYFEMKASTPVVPSAPSSLEAFAFVALEFFDWRHPAPCQPGHRYGFSRPRLL